MTTRSLSILIAVAVAGSFSFAQAAKVDCTPVADATTKAVTANPEKVLEIVAKDAAANPPCVCPIIKAAIAACNADADLQEQIVQTAAATVPERTPEIKACLPKAASWLDLDFLGAPMSGVAGTYLSAPSSGGGGNLNPEEVVIIEEVVNPRPKIVKLPPSTPATP